MKIEWKIKKERGFDRPQLWYKVLLEDWEEALNIPLFVIQSTIPMPKTATSEIREEEHCKNDDHDTYKQNLSNTRHGNGIRLPFRQSGEYPEVAESMALLRDEIERRIIQAHDSLALEITGSLEMTPATKRHVAAYVAAWKMTQQNP